MILVKSPMKAIQKYSLLFILFTAGIINAQTVSAQQTIIKYLSGTGNDHTVTWDFYCTGGRISGKWATIQVPSCWELQGFGNYNYGNGKESHSDEKGLYRYHFKVDKQWKNKQVNIVFEGSMTDTKVQINGRLAGKIHQGAFYQFKYGITSLLKFGKENLLEVEMSKQSANQSVNEAERHGDFWIFGGIFRPVYLEVLPKTHIRRVAINTRADGHFSMQVFATNINKNYSLEAEIENTDSHQKLKTISLPVATGDTMVTLKMHYNNVDLWSPEFPHLYRVKVSLKNEQGKIVHSIYQKFGFRTVELRLHDGFYLNGKKVMFKGVDHHSFWPESGRTTSKALSIEDVGLMKDMNMNAVRMSHYPPDIHLLDVCDSLGLMVLDELTGWQHAYDDTTGHRLVKEMVVRDVNHPAIVIWDNGNEGGFNYNLDKDFDLYDPQKRLVIHPWEKFNGTNTKHYPSYNFLENIALYGTEVYFPTEWLHGLYDGGSGAGLDDYWNLMKKMPRSAGGFLWVFADEGIVRTDKHDSIDTHGNNAPDGILGPHREIEGSYYTIKQIWSPVQIHKNHITPDFDGKLQVENRYLFTNLDQCTFEWQLVSFGRPSDKKVKTIIDATGQPLKISIDPGETKWMNLQLPDKWTLSDALYLTARDSHDKEIFTWSWPIKSPAEIAEKEIQPSTSLEIKVTDQTNALIVNDGNIQIVFNKETGYLAKVIRNDSLLSLSDGPALAGFDQKLESFKYKNKGDHYEINAEYKGKDNWLKVKWIFRPGMPVKLDYSFSQKGTADYMGITFDYPEKEIAGMQWLGGGPYHVWKNRLKGLKFGVWEKAYNNTITGESWKYPEFRGNHKDLYWVKIESKEFPFTIFTENRNLFLQMLNTPDPKGAYNDNTTVSYSKGNLGFMNAIQAIGTKFHPAQELGPQSQPNVSLNAPYEGVLWFDFRKISN